MNNDDEVGLGPTSLSVKMLDGSVHRGASLTLEAFAKLRRGDNRNVALQPGIAGTMHYAHAACAERRKDFIGS